MPPVLDEALVSRLAELAARIDGANPGQWEDDLHEFNRLAGTSIAFEEFQSIYGGEEHENYVRRLLYYKLVKPAPCATRAELAEVVRRAMPQNEFFEQHEAYAVVFDANVPLAKASNLIFYPADYDPATNTWDGGRPIVEYNPTPEQIVEWALAAGYSGDR